MAAKAAHARPARPAAAAAAATAAVRPRLYTAAAAAAAAPAVRARRRHLSACTATASGDPATLAAAAGALRSWVQASSPLWPAQLEAVLVDSSGRHRMLAAAPGVEAGSLLLAVPERLFMTANTAVRSTHCGRLVKAAQLTEWQALVLHLLCERAAGDASPWAAYIAVLGDQAHHPLQWDGQVQQQLAGSAMARTLEARLQVVQEDTDVLLAAGANELDVAAVWQQQTQSPLVSVASVRWAAAVLLSRCFSLDLSEPDLPVEGDMSSFGSWQQHGPASLALVPWADMVRHSSDAGEEALLVFEPEARAAVLTADRAYSPGQEVFSSHGPRLSWADLLMDHGCVGEGGSDHPRYDAELGAHLKPRGRRNEAVLAALAGLTGCGPAAAFTPEGPDAMSLAVVRAGLATDAELVAAGWRLTATARDVGLCARVMGALGAPQSLATEARVVGVLAGVVDAALGAFPSSLAQDEQELAQLAAGSGEQQEQQQLRAGILRGLVSEKAALVGSQDALRGWAAQLAALGAAGKPVKPAQIAAAVYGHEQQGFDS